MNLGKIKAEDLILTEEIEDDRVNTRLQLNDYDWRDYTLSTSFNTEKYGGLKIKFEHFGTTLSRMTVSQIVNNVSDDFEFKYDTKIFIKHIKKFMNDHINAWESEYAFNGEDNVLNFYNEVIEVCNKSEI